MTAHPTHPLQQKVRPPRIAVLSGYMLYYEPHMPPGFRAEREAWGRGIAEILGSEGEEKFFGLLLDDETGRRIGAELAAWQPDAVVLAPAMPGPPAFTWAALVDLPRVPVVIWTANHLDALPATYNSVDHLANSGNVGVAMIGNILARNGRKTTVVTGRWYEADSQQRARSAARAAAAAGRVAKARVGVLGQPLGGYSNVIVDGDELKNRIGAELVPVTLSEWEAAFTAATDESSRRIATALDAFDVMESEGEDLRAAYRLAAALESVADRHALDCGTFNSHLEYSHNNPKIGLVGGLANSWLTSSGIPFTDTGDTITAIAMLIGRLLSGTAVYTELNTIDYAANAILCANTGEVDFSAAAHVSIFPAKSFTGKQQRGAIIDAELRTGPATILGFTPHPQARGGFRLIVFPGHVTGRPDIDLHVPHSLFRPAGLDAPTGFSRWIEAGATHHACLSLGDIVEPARLVGNLLGIDVEVIA